MNENHEGGSRSTFADTHRAALQAAVAGPCIRHEEPFGLPGLLRAQYEQTPDAVACSDAGRVLTYRDLELLSDAAAELLARTAPGTGRVLLLLRRGVDVLVAMLGVLKAGCSYIPVDIDEPESRLASIVAQAQPVTVFAERDIISATLGDLPRLNVPRETGDRGDPAPLRPVPVNQPVYIMFTSGSTGEPKGVILGSEALVNRLLWMQRQYGLTAADRILQKTPYTFDVSGWELFWPLLVGARCVFAPHGAHRDPVMLAALLAEHEITVCHFVPSMLAEFLRAPAAADAISLRHVFCSGEALPARIARHCLAILPAQLHNLYGPTEAAIDVTYWPVPRDLAETDEVLIGAPIANTRLYVLDEERCPVPEGEVGELWIGGQPVALGYVGREDLTALAFAAIGGDRCYRTGDLVRQAGDALGYLGRADEQVKVRGVRVEPLEVEHVLDACPGVGRAVVTAVRGTGGDSKLVAVLRAQPAPGGRPDEAEIRRHLAERLPPAFMPSALCWVDHVLLNRSGKTDRPGIRAQMQSWWDSRTPAPEDSDPIRAAWLAAIDRPADGVPEYEGYLTAGGQSLSAVRLVATVRERFGVVVPLSLLLDSDISLSGLRDFVSAALRAVHAQNGPDEPGSGFGPELANGGRMPAGAEVAYTERSPLAPEQQRLWMLSRLYPGSPAYNVTIVLKFRGALVASALERALAALAGQHDMLRARVSEDAAGHPWLQ